MGNPESAPTGREPVVLRPTWLHKRRGAVSFAELTWSQITRPPEDEERQEMLTAFEADAGKIVESYWCASLLGGVVLTEKRPHRWLPHTHETRMYRMTELLVRNEPEFANLLLAIDQQCIRVANVLSGMSRRIALFSLFASTRHVLTYLESIVDKPTTPDVVAQSRTVTKHQWESLRATQKYYGQAAARQAQIVYQGGMFVGFLLLCLAAVILGFLFQWLNVPGVDLTIFLGCLIAGGVGAIMSVLMRMGSGGFDVTHEIGREYLARLGAFRPAIGGTSALLLYFTLVGGLLPNVSLPPPGGARSFAFFLAVGFLVGFSERLAKEMIGTAEATIGAGTARVGQEVPPTEPSASLEAGQVQTAI